MVPAAANGPPSGHGIRITGAVHVAGSPRRTPWRSSSAQIMSWHAAMTGARTAPRTATYPPARKTPISSSLSIA